MAADERRKHILVINDVPVLLEVFRDLLEGEGYRVSLDNFSDFDLAGKLADVKRLKPDALILDFVFGGEPLGWQLLQLLKLDRATERIPVVVCTAAAAQVKDLEGHLRTMGVATVLKPFDIDTLLAAVTQALAGGPVAVGLSPAPPE
ncbi:MAG TPA: response regulator [Thermomicrobiales bacterium]|nr:response regulator [Thermomicrobiales bacterium]